MPSNQLEMALWLESDRMGYLLPTLTEPSLKNQIDVVRNERRQRIDNVPYGPSGLAMSEALYPAGHPYKHQTIGRHEDLEAATLADVVGFYKTWYVPANATLTLCGDFDPKTVKDQVAKWFGGFPASTKPVPVAVPPPVLTSARLEVKDTFAKLRQVTWAWLSPANYGPDDAELDIAASALAREGTGRLYRILVYEQQLAQSVRAYQSGQGFSGTFEIAVTLRTGADQAAVEKIVTAEVAKLARENLSDREVARFVTASEASAIYSLENLLTRANRLQGYNHYLGNPDSLTWDLDRYRKTTPDKIRAAVAKYLTPDHHIVLVTTPAAAPSAGATP